MHGQPHIKVKIIYDHMWWSRDSDTVFVVPSDHNAAGDVTGIMQACSTGQQNSSCFLIQKKANFRKKKINYTHGDNKSLSESPVTTI